MAITSETPTSRRGYLSESELEQFADITVLDSSEGIDRISQAEELIDAFIGYQDKFLTYIVAGMATAGTSDTITLEDVHQNVYKADFFKWCEVEIIGGTGADQRRRINSSTLAGVLTVDTAWDTSPDSTSFYKIYQLGKFPRKKDVEFDSSGSTYYKSIPEAIKRAVAAQVAYIIEMGDGFFAGDEADKESERIGDYSYTKAQGATGVSKLIAPRAKMLLRGYINRIGQITV